MTERSPPPIQSPPLASSATPADLRLPAHAALSDCLLASPRLPAPARSALVGCPKPAECARWLGGLTVLPEKLRHPACGTVPDCSLVPPRLAPARSLQSVGLARSADLAALCAPTRFLWHLASLARPIAQALLAMSGHSRCPPQERASLTAPAHLPAWQAARCARSQVQPCLVAPAC